VLIEPAAARAFAQCGWRLSGGNTFRQHNQAIGGLNSGTYLLEMTALPGFQTPAPTPVVVNSGVATTVTFTYFESLTPLEYWRQVNFGTTDNSGTAADNADPDRDGRANIEEYAAGTNPNNASDVFKVLTTQISGSSFTVTAKGKAGRSYTLQKRTDLATGSWSVVTSAGALTTDGPVILTDLAATAQQAFYRIQVSAP
jgi:hypothetical protein